MRNQTADVLHVFCKAQQLPPRVYRGLKRTYNLLPSRSKYLFKQACREGDVPEANRIIREATRG